MLGRTHKLDADLVREHRDIADLFEHLLIAFTITANRTQRAPLLKCSRDRRQDEQRKLHRKPFNSSVLACGLYLQEIVQSFRALPEHPCQESEQSDVSAQCDAEG